MEMKATPRGIVRVLSGYSSFYGALVSGEVRGRRWAAVPWDAAMAATGCAREELEAMIEKGEIPARLQEHFCDEWGRTHEVHFDAVGWLDHQLPQTRLVRAGYVIR
jgi:hypothetical protein